MISNEPNDFAIYKARFASDFMYMNRVKGYVFDLVKKQLRLLGIRAEDIETEEGIEKYQLKRHELIDTVDKSIVQLTKVLGITIVTTTYYPDHTLISSTVEVDYTDAKLWVSSFVPKSGNYK